MLVLKMLYRKLIAIDAIVNKDPRTSHLPLVGNPLPMALVIAAYLLVTLKLGPKWMEKRKAYDCKLPMQIYNVLQVAINVYIFIASFYYSYWQSDFNLTCMRYDPLDSREFLMRLRYPAYVYYINKYVDWLDTVFFVLRKKSKQISFLHVYHHSAMAFAVWVYMTLLFGSHYTAVGTLNSFVHICLYAYYFVAALNLKVDLNVWKKRLTQLQIAQFLYLALHCGLIVVNNWCGLDEFWSWVVFVQNFFMLILFCDFYHKSYIRPHRQQGVAGVATSQQIFTKVE